MVKQGPFLVELVRADTRHPFKEHKSEKNEIYAEVEPDIEYFIRLKHSHPGHSIVRADFTLDGESLGYCTNLIRGQEELHGLWTIQGDKKINQALKFCVQESELDVSKRWVGSLEVTFSEAVPDGVRKTRDYKNKWTRGRVGGCIDNLMRKAIKSGEGELSLISSNPKRKKYFDAGAKLQATTIYYCTAVGLIQAGLLPRPPFWDTARIKHPREIFSPKKISSSTQRCLEVQPKPLVAVPENKELGLVEKVVDFFDLVVADNSDDCNNDGHSDECSSDDHEIGSDEDRQRHEDGESDDEEARCNEDALPATDTQDSKSQIKDDDDDDNSGHESADKNQASPPPEDIEDSALEPVSEDDTTESTGTKTRSSGVKRKLNFSQNTSASSTLGNKKSKR